MNKVQNKVISQTKKRIQRMNALYAVLLTDDIKKQKAVLNSFIKKTTKVKDEQEIDFDDKDVDIILKAINSQEELIDIFKSNVEQWRWDRIGIIEKAIILQAYVEFKYFELPKPIAIDQSLKMAHNYCEEQAFSFINKSLENILK